MQINGETNVTCYEPKLYTWQNEDAPSICEGDAAHPCDCMRFMAACAIVEWVIV